jgi:heme exporter protein D
VLCAAQAATVAAPARQAQARGRSWVWLAVPAALLGAGVLIVNAVPQGPHWLARLATFGTPVLAGTYGFFRGSPRWWLWPPAAVGLWFAAWLAGGLVRGAAGTALIALACLAAASAIAMVAPAWSIRVGLVCLAALDIVLVWATPSVRQASNSLEQVQSPIAAGRSLPSLQQVSFGHAFMGWLDLLAPALLGVVVAGRTKLGAAVVTGLAAGLWGLLFYVTSEVAATVPVLAGLAFAAVDARRSRLRHPLEPARAGGGPRGDRRGGA